MSDLTQEMKLNILKSVDSVKRTKGLGVLVDIDGKAEIIRHDKFGFQQSEYLVVVIQSSDANLNMNDVYKEAGLMAINCSAAIIAGLVTFGSAGFSPFSGGTSLIVTGASYAATLATGASCFNSVLRTYNSVRAPEVNMHLDKMPAYNVAMTVFDGVSIVGVGASAVTTIKIMGMLKRAGVTVKGAMQRNIIRQARTRLSHQNIKASRPGISNGAIKKMIRAGEAPRRMTKMAISDGSVKALKDSFAAGLSFLSSAFDGNIRNLVVYVVTLEN